MAVLESGMLAQPLIWTPTSPIFIKCHGLKSSRYKPSRLGVPTGAANCKERGVFNNPYSLFNCCILLRALGFLLPGLPLLPPFYNSKMGRFWLAVSWKISCSCAVVQKRLRSKWWDFEESGTFLLPQPPYISNLCYKCNFHEFTFLLSFFFFFLPRKMCCTESSRWASTGRVSKHTHPEG